AVGVPDHPGLGLIDPHRREAVVRGDIPEREPGLERPSAGIAGSPAGGQPGLELLVPGASVERVPVGFPSPPGSVPDGNSTRSDTISAWEPGLELALCTHLGPPRCRPFLRGVNLASFHSDL